MRKRSTKGSNLRNVVREMRGDLRRRFVQRGKDWLVMLGSRNRGGDSNEDEEKSQEENETYDEQKCEEWFLRELEQT